MGSGFFAISPNDVWLEGPGGISVTATLSYKLSRTKYIMGSVHYEFIRLQRESVERTTIRHTRWRAQRGHFT